MTLTITEADFTDLSQLYISLEGKETFIFKSGEPKPRMASTIQNQSKFYQSEQVLLHSDEAGLRIGRHTFDFAIDCLDETGKRPPSFNWTCGDTESLIIGKGALAL